MIAGAAWRVALVALVLSSGCGSQGRATTVRVFAASSLTEAFTALGRQFEAAHPGTHVVFDFASSSNLARKIIDGAPADVYASADEMSMAEVVRSRRAGNQPIIVARNQLQLVVAPGNPHGIAGLADLSRSGVTFVQCAPPTPCGRLAALALSKAGVTAKPASLEANAKAVVTKVVLREVDAGIAYLTDVRAASGKATGVALENAADPDLLAVYPIVAVRQAEHPDLAQRWVDFVTSAAGQDELVRFGFLVG